MATTTTTTPYSPVVTPATATGIDQSRGVTTPTVATVPQQPTTAINASNLAPQPTLPAPTVPPSTTAQNSLGASVASYQPPSAAQPPPGWDAQTYANFKAANPTLEPTAEDTAHMQQAGQTTPQNAILNRLLGYNNDLGNQGDFTTQTNKQYGIDTKSQQVTDLTNEYNSRSRYYDDQIQAVTAKNALGISADAQQQKVDELTRQKNHELADIAIQQSAANGNLSTAQALAKQVVDAKFEPIKQQISLMQTMYGLLQNDMTESEKMKAQANIASQSAQVQFGQQKEMAAYQERIKESSPEYAAQVANERAQASLNQANADLFQQMSGGGSTGTGGSTDLSTNPGAIKLGAATQHWVDQGLATVSPNTAADGGHFLIFKDLATGIQAQKQLLFGPNYSNLTVSQALNKWSNGGYAGNIAPDIANKKMGDLTPAEQNYLMASQMHREGTSSPAAYSAALAGSNGFPGDPKTASATALLNYAVLQGHVDPNAIKITRGNPASVMSYVNILRANPDFNFNAASANAAATKTAANIQAKTSTQLQQSAGTVLQHLPQIAEDLKGLTRTGTPFINSILNTVGSATSQNTQKYLSDLKILRGEIANVLASNGVPTDKARGEAEGILPSNMNYNGFMNLVGDVKSGTGILNLMQAKIVQYGQPTNIPQQKTSGDSFKPL